MRYMVSGRPQIGGRDAVSRAGHHWPRGGQLIEVLETDEDPPADLAAEKAGAPKRIGKKTWEALKADKILISITAEGEVEKDALALREENAALKARIAELEGEAADESPGSGSKPSRRK